MTAPSVRQRPTPSDNARRRRTARTARLDVRLGATGLEAVDAAAARDGRTRSEWSRNAIAYAVAHMPPGWHPATGRTRGARP